MDIHSLSHFQALHSGQMLEARHAPLYYQATAWPASADHVWLAGKMYSLHARLLVRKLLGSAIGTCCSPEGHEAGCVANRWALVAHHVGHRQAHTLALWRQQLAAPHHLCHPGTTALLCWARVGVQVAVGLGRAILSHIMPSCSAAARTPAR